MATTPLPSTVRLGTGDGGLRTIEVDAPAGCATIYRHGAQVTDWTPRGHRPVLWLSTRSRYTSSAAIRGGVPICFPWFGPHPDPTAPAHGFARLSEWELVDVHDDGQQVEVVLRLTDPPVDSGEDSTTAGSRVWPHAFEAVYTVRVGRHLSLGLTVTNRDTVPLVFAEALHTYLRVADVRTASVTGLEGTPFLDKVAGGTLVPGEPEPLRFSGPTDRVYQGTTATTVVHDPVGGRAVTVRKDGSSSTVVWNPWSDGASTMADLGTDEWVTMLCVETANVGDAAVRLEPGQSHTMTAVLEVEHASGGRGG